MLMPATPTPAASETSPHTEDRGRRAADEPADEPPAQRPCTEIVVAPAAANEAHPKCTRCWDFHAPGMCPIPFGCGKCHPAQFDGECGICGYPIKKADPVEGIVACVISKCYELGHVHTLPLLHKLPPLLSRTLVANEPALQRSATETLGKHSSANRHLGLCIGELVRQRPRWLI